MAGTPLPFILLLLVEASALLCPSNAVAQIRMKWDCYLPSGSVDCSLLETSLMSKIPFLLTGADRPSADVIVTVTSIAADMLYSNPKQEVEASMLAAVRRGYTAPFGVQSGLGIRYLFGKRLACIRRPALEKRVELAMTALEAERAR